MRFGDRHGTQARKSGSSLSIPTGGLQPVMPRALDAGLYRAIGWRGRRAGKGHPRESTHLTRVFSTSRSGGCRSTVDCPLGVGRISWSSPADRGWATHQRGTAQARAASERKGVDISPLDEGTVVDPVDDRWGAITGLLVDALLGGKGWSLVARRSRGRRRGALALGSAITPMRRTSATWSVARTTTTPAEWFPVRAERGGRDGRNQGRSRLWLARASVMSTQTAPQTFGLARGRGTVVALGGLGLPVLRAITAAPTT